MDMIWESIDEKSLEHLYIKENSNHYKVDSVVINYQHRSPYRLYYELIIDKEWKTKEVFISLFNSNKEISLHADGQGKWYDLSGNHLAQLDGAIDIDISASPFSNSLPINRLPFKKFSKYEIVVVYFSVPDLSFRPVKQKYTCLDKKSSYQKFQYQCNDFIADIKVDNHGFVIEYPELFLKRY